MPYLTHCDPNVLSDSGYLLCLANRTRSLPDLSTLIFHGKQSSTDLDLVSAIEIVFLKKEEPGELRVRKTRKFAKKEKKGLIRFWTRLVLT